MSRTCLRARLAAALALVLGAAAGGAHQNPSIRILEPRSEHYVVGPSTFRVAIDGPDESVAEVTFYVDGLAVCRVTQPPWGCTWDAGSGVRQRHVRAVATLRSGERLTTSEGTAASTAIARVNVNAVLIGTSVRDRRGRPVPGLGADDFRVYEEGVEQPITFFAADDWPADLVLAVDLSSSMQPYLPRVRSAARALLKALRPIDRVTVAGFNDRFFVMATREATPEARSRAIDRMTTWGTTALFDALMAASQLVRQDDGRQAVVVFTDGADTSSLASETRVAQAILASNVLIYVVGYGEAGTDTSLRDSLEQLAGRSGGRALFIRSLAELSRAFSVIVEDLTSQYTLGYGPESGTAGEWRSIRVELRDRRHQVRAREGYVVPQSVP